MRKKLKKAWKLPKNVIEHKPLSDGTVIFTVPGKKSWRCSECNHFWHIGLKDPKPTKCVKCFSQKIICKDIKVKARLSKLNKTITPKHAHFAIDLYGKLCFSKDVAQIVFGSIEKVFRDTAASQILQTMSNGDIGKVDNSKGYNLEYILNCMELIFKSEEMNYPSTEKNPKTGDYYQGKKFTFDLFQDVMNGTHPVEAMIKKNLRI